LRRGAAVGLSTAVILTLLAIQAEPITGVLGLLMAALHTAAVVMLWYADKP
jgi:hypothetical protein